MNLSTNVQRIESGPAHIDATGDNFVTARMFDAAAARHLDAMNAGDLVDLVTEMEVIDVERMLSALKSGDAAAAGAVLAEAFAARITDLAAYSVQQ